MAVYMINYDLKSPGQNYDKVISKITKSYPDNKKVLYSAYFVNTPQNSQQISDTIKPAFDTNDNFLVLKVTSDRQGWLPRDVWDWLRARS